MVVCEKHNSMYLYVQKWESLKVYFKVIKFEVIRFPRLQSQRLFLCAGNLDHGRGKGWRMSAVNCWGGGEWVDI